MAMREIDDLKLAAEEYAGLIASGNSDMKRIGQLRNILGFDLEDMDTEDPSNKGGKTGNSDRVGIWKKQIIDGEKFFIRDKECEGEFNAWADVKQIPPKGEKFRIAYLGESTARGFLYDPYFNPATYLEELMNLNGAGKSVEVIDLSKISIKIEAIRQLSKSCTALDPDVIIVFAGCTWRKSMWDLTGVETEEFIEKMEGPDRFENILSILERRGRKMISDLMDTLNTIKVEQGIPIVIIIPEFNSKGWRSNASERILCWEDGKTGEWLQQKKEAENCMLEGKLDLAEAAAQRMIDINKANPLGYEIIAQIKQIQGKTGDAREYYEAARDTNMFRLGPPPGTTSFIRNMLLEEAQKYDFYVLDLPELLKQYLKGGIPGYDLLIDYCHLTVEGIHIAMKRTARLLLSILKHSETRIQDIVTYEKRPESRGEALAHFFAAIHSAHIGDQSYQTLYDHCKKAVSIYPDIARTMIQYIDITLRKIPWPLNKNFEAVFTRQYAVLRHLDDCRIMDIELVRAIVEALKEIDIDVKQKTDERRIGFHRPSIGKKVNLLESYYRENSYFFAFAASKSIDYENPHQCYTSIRDVYSVFTLVWDKSSNVKLDITLRSPFAEKQEKIYIKVNNVLAVEVEALDQWQDVNITVPLSILKEDGLNTIAIEWPLIDKSTQKINEEYKRKYSGFERIVKKCRPAYGEIMRFNAYQDTQ